MLRKRQLLIVLAAAVTITQVNPVTASCAPPSFTVAENKEVPTKRIDQKLLSKAVAKQTNFYRCQRGLKALDHDPRLTSAASIHSKNMAQIKMLEHELPISRNRTLAERFKSASVKVKKIRAENIGTEFRLVIASRVFLVDDASQCRFIYRDTGKVIPVHSYGSLAQSIVKNWWNSPKHRTNMLNKQIKRIGAAAHFTIDHQAPCGTYYFTQDFAG